MERPLHWLLWQQRRIFSAENMKGPFFRSIVLTVLVAAGTLALAAQPTAQSFAGETMTFEGKISKYHISFSVAEMTLAATIPAGTDNLLIKTDADSKGTLIRLFRYSFLQQYESTIDLANFRILKTTKHDVQKERVRDSEAIFDYTAKRVTYVETDPKDATRPPRRIASEIPAQMLDIVSAIYYVRIRPFILGERFDVPVSDSGLVYTVPVRVAGRESFNTALGKKTACIRLEPEIFGPGRLIEQKGNMTLWLTDDARRIPVRAKVSTTFGTAEIKLKSYAKNAPAAPAPPS